MTRHLDRGRSMLLLLCGWLIVGCQQRDLPTSGSAKPQQDVTVRVTSENFDAVVLNSEQPVLVDFWASWCGPCNQLAPVIQQVAFDVRGEAVVAKVDVDANESLANRFDIQALPTIVLFDQGVEVDRFVGVVAGETLRNELRARITPATGT